MSADRPANISTVTDATFDEEAGKPGLALVDFYADWCGPCKVLEPMLDRILAQHPEVRMLRLNVDENPLSTAQFQILSIPTVIFFRDGKQLGEPILGAQKPAVYDALIREYSSGADAQQPEIPAEA